jgi:hypothetical protein
LRRSAITKFSENENMGEVKEEYKIYVMGAEGSDKEELVR